MGDSDSEGMDVDTVEGPTKKVEVVHCMTEEQTKASTASLVRYVCMYSIRTYVQNLY